MKLFSYSADLWLISLDVDECASTTNHTNCSEVDNEMCINTEGSFNCICSKGYSNNSTDDACQGTYLHLVQLLFD